MKRALLSNCERRPGASIPRCAVFQLLTLFFFLSPSSVAMDLIDEEGAERVRRLRKLSKSFRQELIKGADDNFVVKGDLFSPIVHIAFPADSAGLIEAQQRIFQMQAALLEAGVYVSAPIFVGTEHKIPEPTLRMSISASHDKDMLSRAAQIICCKFSEGECTRKETKR